MQLNKNDIHNLLIFLNRTQLSGAEAPTFVELCDKLNQMLISSKEVPEDE